MKKSKTKTKKAKKLKQGRPESTIVVPKKVHKSWSDSYDAGDFTKIKEVTGISRVTIRRAWNEKRASQVNMDKITAFYDERKRQSQIMQEQIKLAALGEEAVSE